MNESCIFSAIYCQKLSGECVSVFELTRTWVLGANRCTGYLGFQVTGTPVGNPVIIIAIIPRMKCCHHDHKVIARVHSVHLMNVEQRQAAADQAT